MKKVSVKTRIISIFSAAVMLLSFATVGAVSASAATDNNQGSVSFEPCGDWGACGAKIMAYFFDKDDASNNAWVNMNMSGNKFTASAPNGCDTVLFARVPGNFVPNQTDTWNQTQDLKIELGKTYKATGFDGKFYTGNWEGSGVTPEEKTVTTLNFVPSQEWRTNNADFQAFFYDQGTGKSAWSPMTIGARNINYTVQVPEGGYTHVIFVRFEKGKGYDFAKAWNKTIDINISKISNQPFYATGWELDPTADGTQSEWF